MDTKTATVTAGEKNVGGKYGCSKYLTSYSEERSRLEAGWLTERMGDRFAEER